MSIRRWISTHFVSIRELFFRFVSLAVVRMWTSYNSKNVRFGVFFSEL